MEDAFQDAWSDFPISFGNLFIYFLLNSDATPMLTASEMLLLA